MSEETPVKKGRPPRELGLFGVGEYRQLLAVLDEWQTARNRWHEMRTKQEPGLNEQRAKVDRLRKELKDMLDLSDGVKVDE